MTQLTLPRLRPLPRFSGATVEPVDVPRLTRQLDKVRAVMLSGEWLTFEEIAERGGINPAAAPGISARLRDLRNKEGYRIDRRRRGDAERGIFEYLLYRKENA